MFVLICDQLQLGRSALHHAVLHGIATNNLTTAQQLISYGADVNAKDEVLSRLIILRACSLSLKSTSGFSGCIIYIYIHIYVYIYIVYIHTYIYIYSCIIAYYSLVAL